MKTSELRVGDWVQARLVTIEGEERLSPPMYIVAIGEGWVQTRVDPEQGDPDEYDIEDIRPIRLTEDFIRLNLTEWLDYDPVWSLVLNRADSGVPTEVIGVLWKNGLARVNYWREVSGAVVRDTTINASYVHELQHLLRFAGIEDEIKIPRSL